MKSQQYLEEIRKSEGLSRAVLSRITVEGGEAVFHLVTDTNYSQEDVSYASGVCRRYAGGMPASARVVKSVPSEEGVRRAVAEILSTRFPAFAAFVSPGDLSVALDDRGGRFFIGVGELECAKGREDHVVDAVAEELGRRFCGSWSGELRRVQKSAAAIEREEIPEEEYLLAPRFFEIAGYSAIDGAAPQRAIYIADLDKEIKDITVCGKISYIEERETKSGKPYFSITVTDGTGSLRAAYFSKKATLEKVRSLAQGMSVCLTGDYELFHGGFTFRVKSVDLGSAPEGFVPKQRPSRPVPQRYRSVFPVPTADFVQADLFGAKPLPASFSEGTYVVFDLETTGLNNASSQGMDRIIEIGAVKIAKGKICEKFSSFVACPVRLSDEIVALTGITDDMLAGAPAVSDVLADFFRFTAGSVLVGHNVQFDYKFIRHYGEQIGFIFDQKQIDTLSFAQETLRLSNYKLNTVADHFGFDFHHHRAYDDAFVTAKIFIELVRLKGGLPK